MFLFLISANRIHISENTYLCLKKLGKFKMKFRGNLDIKVHVYLNLSKAVRLFEVGGLRSRLLLRVICCPIYHWLKVSCEVDVLQARSESDIGTDD